MYYTKKKKKQNRVQESYYVWLYPSWVLLGGSFKMMLTKAWMSWFLQKAWKPTLPHSHKPLRASSFQDKWQYPSDCHFLAGSLSITIFFFFFFQKSLKKLAASNGTFKPHQQLTFQTALFTGQNMTFVLTGSTKYEKWNQTTFFSCLIHYRPQEF